MSQGNRSSESIGTDGEPALSEAGRDALKKLERTLAAQGLPNNERKEYIDRFVLEISGETDEVVMKTLLGRLLLESLKRAKALKLESTKVTEHEENGKRKVNFCGQCGNPVAYGSNFCGMCGNRLRQNVA